MPSFKSKLPQKVLPGKLTSIIPKMRDVEVSYIRDPGAIRIQDPSTGLWQGRMILPDIMSPETLRYAAARSQVFNTILKSIQKDVAQFGRRPMFDGDKGFSVVTKMRNHHMTAEERKVASYIEDFLLNTGRTYNPKREDKLPQYLIKQTYNTYVYDRMPTQLVWNSATPTEFFAIDGSTIIKTDPDVYVPQTDRGKAVAPISFVQLHKDQLWAEFNASELLFGIRNPSPNLESNGYGTPELMELAEPITLEILILTYIDRILTQGSIPDGLLILKSGRSGQALESLSLASGQVGEDFERLLRNQLAGAQNAGRLAVLRLRSGEDAELVVTDRALDKMPYIQTYEIIQNQIARKLNVDPADVGIVTGSIKQSFADQDSAPGKVRQSRSRAVAQVLNAIAETQINRIIDFIDNRFCIQWHGIDTQLEQEKLNLESLRMNMGLMTLNQVIAHQNGVPYPDDDKHWWANVPLHPMIFEAIAAERGLTVQKEQKGDGGIGGESGQRKPGAKPGNGNRITDE